MPRQDACQDSASFASTDSSLWIRVVSYFYAILSKRPWLCENSTRVRSWWRHASALSKGFGNATKSSKTNIYRGFTKGENVISIEDLFKEKKSSGNDEPIYLSLLFGGVGDVRHPMVTLLNLHQQTKNLSVDEKKWFYSIWLWMMSRKPFLLEASYCC
jgi:hypothetical protein